MPLVIWMSKSEFDRAYLQTDKDLREICDEVHRETGEKYAVSKMEIEITSLLGFFGRKKIQLYTVLFWIGNGEAQCINLPGSGPLGECTKGEAGAFLIGLLCRKPEAQP